PGGGVAAHVRAAGGTQPRDQLRAAAAPLRRSARGASRPRPRPAGRRAADRRAAARPAVPCHPHATRGATPGRDALSRRTLPARNRGAPGDERQQCRGAAHPCSQGAAHPARRGREMNEQMPIQDWERVQALWRRAGSAGAVVQDAPRQIARARRRLLVARLIESAVAAAAILITAMALRHAGNPFEAALGLVVGVGIGILWIQRIRLREREEAGIAATSPEHLAVLERVRRQEVRLARFIWIVLRLQVKPGTTSSPSRTPPFSTGESLPSARYTRAHRRAPSTTHTSPVPALSQSATFARTSPGRSSGERTSTTRSGASRANPTGGGSGSRSRRMNAASGARTVWGRWPA